MTSITDVYKLRVFSLEDVIHKFEMSYSAAVAALARWRVQGFVKMVRRNMYVAIDPMTNAPVVDKYELASKTTPLSYVGWHTALEFHGIAHQSFNNAYIGSKCRFKEYSFGGVEYEYCAAPMEASEESGVVTPIGNPYVRVTDLERTIIDCCDRLDRAGGAEELIHCLESVAIFDEQKLERYLEKYNRFILFQKAGFIFAQSQQHNNISNDFIEMCRAKGAVYTQHLTTSGDSDKYVKEWMLYVPKDCIF